MQTLHICYRETYSVQPVLGDHVQPSLFHSSVLPAVVSHTALVYVVGHCVITRPPRNKRLGEVKGIEALVSLGVAMSSFIKTKQTDLHQT